MDRRDFLAASAAAALGLAISDDVARAQAQDAAPPAGGAKGGKQLIEVRTYHFASPEKQQKFARFLGNALVPALVRAGVGPIGVFKLLAKDNAALKLTADPSDLYVVVPYDSLDTMLEIGEQLSHDQQFLQAGFETLIAPKSDPAYTRYESTLLLGFDECPRVEVPTKAPGRLVQLRIYESHSTERARKKIEMFNDGGEIKIFRRLGMRPVFFGQALAGNKLPNLHYMLAFDDQQATDKAWNAFRGDEAWKKLSGDEDYKYTVSNITNLILRPVEGSQI